MRPSSSLTKANSISDSPMPPCSRWKCGAHHPRCLTSVRTRSSSGAIAGQPSAIRFSSGWIRSVTKVRMAGRRSATRDGMLKSMLVP